MSIHRIALCCTAALAVTGGAVAHGQTVTIAPASAISFQDEGTLTHDDTARLAALDGIYGPSLDGTVTANAYATGSSTAWFDAVSLSFDLVAAGVDYHNIATASLEFYIRNGNSGAWSSHSYLVLSGAFNPTNEDSNPAGVFFNLPDGGLISHNIAPATFTSGTFDITIRMWEVNVDMVRLVVTTTPTPGAAAVLGLAGAAGLRRRRR